MVRSQQVSTPRLSVHCLVAGSEDHPTVVLVHGNVSSTPFWRPLIDTLAQRYRVIAPDLRGYGETDSLTHATTRMVLRVICHCVGATDTGAQRVQQQVADALLDAELTVDGRVCFPVRHEQDQPPREDNDTGVLVMTAVDVYRLESEPA